MGGLSSDTEFPQKTALLAIRLLEEAGFEAYAVGGCVRDWLLGRDVHDVDLATSALASEVEHVMEAAGVQVFETGIAHGTVTALIANEPVEITTFRVDGPYEDNRHPSGVTFTRSLEEDLARRDFTINAMAYNPVRGLVDPFGGRVDLAAQRIACVGDAAMRFDEDVLRVMRALRLASQLGFAIEDATNQALACKAPLLRNIAGERVGAELLGILCGVNVLPVLMNYIDVLGIVAPELLPMKGFNQQNNYHPYDVLEHTAHVVEKVPATATLRMAALLHDVGKPSTFAVAGGGRRHFFEHAQASEKIAGPLLKRLRYPTRFIERICLLVKNHDVAIEPTPASVGHWLRELGPEALRELIFLKRADVGSLAEIAWEWLPTFDAIDAVIDDMLASGACFSLRDLAVKGQDLIAAGIPQGSEVGRVLNALLDGVIAGELSNERDALLSVLPNVTH